MKKPVLSIWLMLLLAFVLFCSISVLGPISVGDFELRAASFYADLTESEPDEGAMIDSQSMVDSLNAATPQLDTTSQRILIIGDSMLEGLAPRLAAYSKHNNHKLYSVTWYASSSKHWAATTTLADYIQKIKPTFIFFSTGANELFIKNIVEKRAEYVKTIVKTMGDIPFVWIGPPNRKKDSGINELIQKYVPKGKHFITHGMTLKYTKDGIHPQRSSSEMWMDSVIRWMPEHCPRLIRLDVPDIQKARPDSVVIKLPPKS